jgi:hypothetical protein
MNYRYTLTIPARRMRLPSIPLFPAPDKEAKEYQDK